MITTSNRTAALVPLLLVVGCQGAERPSANLKVAVRPLELADVGEVVWHVSVASALGPVWDETVGSTQFGDGHGAFSYVGPCDASTGANPHTVTVQIVELRDVNGALLVSPQDYKDPGPITRGGVVCLENADVLVVFDITILRAARQGFFDVAVNFRDVFCSAKLDCKNDLLHDVEGRRAASVVTTFACTAGGADATWLYLSDAELTCVDADPTDATVLSPITTRLSLATSGDGQQGARPPLLFDWARYAGHEALPGMEKCYWNHAFGLDLTAIGARRCTMTLTGTASDAALPGGVIDPAATWPIITWSVEVVGPGGALCDNNALDAQNSGVVSGYLLPSPDGTPPPSFAAEFACGDAIAPLGFACADSPDASFRATTVAGAEAVAVTVDGVPSAHAYRLPASTHLGDACCTDACCKTAAP